MISKIQYFLLFAWVKFHAFLPMKVLYVLSDILYVFIYKIVGYRLKVTRANMKAAFPDKTEAERLDIERRFYHHFSDYILETIKLAGISRKEISKRAVITNPGIVDKLMDDGHPCVIMLLGHYGNWEWYTTSGVFFKDAVLRQVYRPLKSKAFDELFIYLRTRFGASGIKKNDTIRDVITLAKNKIRSCVVLVSDQTPSKANIHYWSDFLNQDSAMFTGGERMASKLDLPVVFADARKTARGYYEVEFKLITDKPKETPEFWITEQYTRMMEATIMRDPAYWLWTHKRWKHKRNEE